MPMRIDNTPGDAGQTSPIQQRLAQLARNRAPATKNDGPSAEVELSSAARDLMRASQIARLTPEEVRADRVAAFQAQVDAGTYRVNSGDLARRILEQLRA